MPDNAISAFLYLYTSKLSYQDLCCQRAKGITTPFPASEVHAVVFVNNWMIPSSSPCVYDELAEATSRVSEWQSGLPLREKESESSQSKFQLFLLH